MKFHVKLLICLVSLACLSCSKTEHKITHDPLSSLGDCSSIENDLYPHDYFNDLVTVQLPRGLFKMPEDMIKKKYPSEHRPSLVMTNLDGSVNVAMNYTKDKVSKGQVGDLHKAVVKMFKSTFPDAEWNESKLYQMEDRTCFIVDLVSSAIDTDIRNIIMGTSANGRLFMITFNTTVEQESEWIEKGKCIISSVVVKD